MIEWFHLLDRRTSPSPVNDVSAVSRTVPCRLDIKHDLKLAAILRICSEVFTHWPDRHKATAPCPVYQKQLAARIRFFSINQDWQRGKIGCVLSRALGQKLWEFKLALDKLGCGQAYQTWLQSWSSTWTIKTVVVRTPTTCCKMIIKVQQNIIKFCFTQLH